MAISARVALAVDTFRDVERAQFLLARRERQLAEWQGALSKEELRDYYELTERIRKEYAQKMEKAGLT